MATMTVFERRLAWFDAIFAVLCAGLLVFSVARWRGWIGGAPPDRPIAMVLIGAALLLQPVGRYVSRRSPPLAFVFFSIVVALLVGAFRAI